MSKKNKKQKDNLLVEKPKSRIDLYKRSTYRKRKTKPDNALKTMMRVMKFLYVEWKKLILIVSLISVTIVATLGIQYITKIIIDDIIDKHIKTSIPKEFFLYIIILGVIYLVSVLSLFISNLAMIRVTQQTLKRMRKNLFSKLQILNVRFFDRNRDGDLMSRLTNDVNNISTTMTQTFTSFITSALTLILTIGMMIYLNWKLTIVAMVTIPLIYYAAKMVSHFSRKRFRRMRYEIGALNGFVAEQISGAKVIQSFCQEDEIITEFAQESNRVRKITINAMTWASLMRPIMQLLGNLRQIIIVIAGVILAINGDKLATVGTITVFISLANQFGNQINNLANMYTDIQNALSGAERVFDVLDDDDIRTDASDALTVENIKGKVEFKHVNFEYLENTPVLNDISINAKPGKKIALVGHTGAGKTTIINLLTRFYDIEDGEILLDGINIQNITHASLLNHVGIVLQDTNLFSDTIFNNVRYGKLDATLDEVINACKLANCHDFIMKLPEQYDTKLAHNGENLSYGQRQLLSIARTILKNPDVLILDEATSSVDTITEKRIQGAIENLTAGKTSFIIAHRLSTIRHADLIIVMEGGKIIEQGSHEELLMQKGIYYQLQSSKGDSDLKDFDLVSA